MKMAGEQGQNSSKPWLEGMKYRSYGRDLSACFSETGFGHGGKRGIAVLLKEFFQDLFFLFRLV